MLGPLSGPAAHPRHPLGRAGLVLASLPTTKGLGLGGTSTGSGCGWPAVPRYVSEAQREKKCGKGAANVTTQQGGEEVLWTDHRGGFGACLSAMVRKLRAADPHRQGKNRPEGRHYDRGAAGPTGTLEVGES